MNRQLIDWIWHIRGSVAIAPELSGDDAFARLEPLFKQAGTSHERTKGVLTFKKKDQAAQDKMSIFDDGILSIEKSAAGSVLRYDLASRILLFCFLAPLLFLGVAQLTIALNKPDRAASQKAGKTGNGSDTPKKAVAKKIVDVPMNPIDKALGAPAPEKPGKKGADKDKDKSPTATPAYVFAAIFAVLYIVGRILEARLINTLFRKKLAPA